MTHTDANAARKCPASPVTVVIAGEPVAKARPRLTRRGIAYTPAHTRKYEAHGRLAAQLAMGDRPPIEAPVRLELVAELPIPVSWSGRRRALAVTGDLLPTSRPDVDNYIKAGLDSLNEIVVRDDSQVVEISARKRFSIAPKLVMTVFPLGAACANRAAAARGGVMRRDQQRHRLSQAATTKKGPGEPGPNRRI